MTTTDDRPTHTDLTANEQGRVTIPAWLRQVTGIGPGSRLVAYEEDGRVVLETREHLARRIQREVAAAWTGETSSAVDELIADRRADAAREAEEDQR